MQAQFVAPTTAVGSTSATQKATVTITATGTLSALGKSTVVTQGATNQDYQAVLPNVGVGACSIGTVYNNGDTCTVLFTFKPQHPWTRYGGISLSDTSGNLLGNTYLVGVGTGPQVAFPLSATTVPATLFGGPGTPVGVALDGNGNLYFVDYNGNSLKEIPATSGVIPTNPAPAATTVATAFAFPSAVAVDGSGNIFVIDSSNSGALKEIVAVGGAIPAGATPVIVASNLGGLSSLAVDGSGNVYVATATAVLKYAAVNGVIPAGATGTSVNGTAEVSAAGIAVDAAGDLYYIPSAGSPANPATVFEFVATAGVIPANPTPVALATVNGRNSINALTIDGAGNLYLPAPSQKSIYEIEAVNGSLTGVTNPVVATLASNLVGPFGLAVDGSGNIFIAENNGAPGPIDELNVQNPPTITFNETAANTTSPDSPMTLLVTNNGSDPGSLNIDTQTASAGFILDPSSTCPSVVLLAGETCTDIISFHPTALGAVTGTLSSTDNNLNVAGTPLVVPLAGGVASPAIAVTPLSVPVNTTSVTLTAKITYNGVTPTGAFSFTVNGGSPITSGVDCELTSPTLTTCTAPYNPSSLMANTTPYTITANLAADANNNPASGTGTLTITAVTPGLALTTSNASVAVDTSITFTATETVPPGPNVPTGTMTFTSTPGATICGSVPVTGGVAQCTTSSLAVGSYTITATLAGDANFNGTTATTGQAVTQVTPTVVVTTSNPSVAVDTPVTYTAAITPNSPVAPTAKVSFSETLGGTTTPINNCTAQPVVAGNATCVTSAPALGSYTITATLLGGDANFATKTSAPIPQAVTKGTATVTLTASGGGTSPLNGSVTFTATLTPTSGILPSGKVFFTTSLNGGIAKPIPGCPTSVSVTTVSPVTATCTTTLLNAGSNSIGATLSLDSNFNDAAATAITETVNQGTATVTVIPDTTHGAITTNGTATIVAVITPNTGVVPLGPVSFTTTLNGATTPITACSAVPLVAGTGPTSLTATCSTTALQSGQNNIVATLTGDNNFPAVTSTSLAQQQITTADTTLAVTSSGTPSAVDLPVTFTATVSSALPFTSTSATGVVSFFLNGSSVIPTCDALPLSTTNHTAKCVVTNLVAPSDVITAVYTSGDINFNNSTAPNFTQIVTKDATVTAVISSAATTAVVNQTVTFTATITPNNFSANGVPIGGNVTFAKGSANGPVICNLVGVAPNPNGTGTATCSVAFTGSLPSTPIFAVYVGDPNFSTSNSNVAQTVSAAPTTTTVASQENPSTVNTPVTLTATVTFPTPSGAIFPTTATAPSGTVTFSDSLDLTNPISCTPAPATITNGAPSTVSCIHTFATQGNHIITATFTPSATEINYAGSTSSSITEQVNASGTTSITVGTSPSPLPATPTVNQTVTFTAAFTPPVDPALTQPAGTVSYFDSLLVTTPGNPTGAIPNCGSLAVTSTKPATIPNCVETMLVAGTHVITAKFANSDGNFQPMTSQNFSEIVGPTATTVALTSLPATSVVDQAVAFTATVTPGVAGTTNPTGTVSFTYVPGGVTTTLCSAPVSTTGGVTSATCTAPFTAFGTYNVTAIYSSDNNSVGSANFAGSTSTADSQVVNKASTSVGSSNVTPASPAVNQFALYSVQISVLAPAIGPGSGSTVPTGNVVFTDTTTSATCTAVVQSNGLASCQFAEPAAGTHTVTVTYNGDGNFTLSSLTPSATVTTIASGTTVTNVTVNPNPPAVNASTTLTATLNPAFSGATLPNGSVVFSDTIAGVTATCTSAVTAGSVAPCQHIFTSSGAHTVTAMFNPSDPSFSSSTSAPLVVTVGGAAPTTIQVGTTTPSIVVNQVATFTAAFTPTIVGTQPKGTVSYFDSALVSPTNTTGAISGANCSNAAINNGIISNCSETMLVSGTHNIVVVYTPTPGNTDFPAITSQGFPQSVAQNTTKTALTSPTAPSIVNQPLTFTATVTPVTVGPGATTPGGTVTFTYVLNGGLATAICVGPVSTTGSVTSATCTAPLITAGTYALTATYSGDPNFVTSASAGSSETVNPNTTTVAITSPAPNTPDVVDQMLTFTASVTPTALIPAATGSSTPNGTVSFFRSGSTTALCSAPVSFNGTISSATCNGLFPAIGTYTVTATFVPSDNNFVTATSAISLSQTVAKEGTSIAFVSSSPTTPTIGQQATYTVQVSLLNSISDTVVGASVPTGTVTFLDAATLATCTAPTTPAVVLGTGQASCSIVEPSQGTHTITATYNGDSNFLSSAVSFSEIITSAPLTLNLQASSPVIIQSKDVIFTATLVAPGVAPTGSVTFFATSTAPGSLPQTLCGGSVPVTTGSTGTSSAICDATFATTGVYVISAHYSGDSNYSAADGAQTPQLVVQGFAITGTPSAQITLAQGTVEGSIAIPNSNLTDAFVSQKLTYTVTLQNGFNDTLAATCVFVDPTKNNTTITVPGLTCTASGLTAVPPAPALPTAFTGTYVITATGTTNPASPLPALGVYTAQLSVADTAVVGTQTKVILQQVVSTSVTIINQPSPIFVPAVGRAVATFTLPPTLTPPTPLATNALSCDSSHLATSNPDGTFTSNQTFAAVGIQCSAVTASGTGYQFTITAGQPGGTAKLMTANSGIVDALLGAPFLLLFGLLPAFRKQRKLLVRGLGMLLLGITIIQTTGCGGGGFTSTVLPQALTGSYLIKIVNSTGATVAEVPIIISNGGVSQ